MKNPYSRYISKFNVIVFQDKNLNTVESVVDLRSKTIPEFRYRYSSMFERYRL